MSLDQKLRLERGQLIGIFTSGRGETCKIIVIFQRVLHPNHEINVTHPGSKHIFQQHELQPISAYYYSPDIIELETPHIAELIHTQHSIYFRVRMVEYSLIGTCSIHSGIVDNDSLPTYMLIHKLGYIVHFATHHDPISITRSIMQDDPGNIVGFPFLRGAAVGGEDILHVTTFDDQLSNDVLYLRFRSATIAPDDSFQRFHD